MKVCKKCSIEYLGARCKVCSNKYHSEYRKSHPDQIKKSRDLWISKNPEKQITILSNKKEKNRIGMRIWRALNKEKSSSYKSAWANKNKEYLRIRNQNRRAKIRDGGKLSADIIQKLLILQQGRCVFCEAELNDDYQLDHIMPIALDGENVDCNMQLLHAICNQRKHAKHPIDFMRENGKLL